MLRKLCLLVAFTSTVVASPVLACNGEACGDVSVKTDGKGCILVQNRGMRAVKVKLGAVSFTVRGGETFYPKDVGGSCLTRYFGSDTATYTS